MNKNIPNKQKKSYTFYTVLANVFNFKVISKSKYNDLVHFKDSNTGLYAIDQNPKNVDYKWIIENNFRIT
jgi:hypothetical protein|tara:strand:- start:598 stop:807 length:210 start_codon:yes stop_codon:yes gene_type:complete